jgi:hypothetical protein
MIVKMTGPWLKFSAREALFLLLHRLLLLLLGELQQVQHQHQQHSSCCPLLQRLSLE